MWKPLSLTIGLCFGVGRGLAPTLPVAHASKCNGPGNLGLELEAIEGDGDPDVEEDFWSRSAGISANAASTSFSVGGKRMELRP